MTSLKPPRSAVPPTLMVGDVLLMLGHGEISKVIAWSSDSIYSHAAIVADHDQLIEAATNGVRQVSLSERLHDAKNYHYIDAFRPLTAHARPLTGADRDCVLRKAVSLLHTQYPLDTLATLGLLIAIRGKIPQSEWARWLFHLALDYIVDEDPRHQMCSEVVYRSLAECDVEPRAKLAPVIVTTPPTHWSFPDVDWPELIREIREIKRRRRSRHLEAQALEAGDGRAPHARVTDDELERRIRDAREKYGIEPAPDTDGAPVPHPNPKLITPLDLTSTPSHTALGRLLPPAS